MKVTIECTNEAQDALANPQILSSAAVRVVWGLDSVKTDSPTFLQILNLALDLDLEVTFIGNVVTIG